MKYLKSFIKLFIPKKYAPFLRAASLVGWKVSCPCCGWSFRQFFSSPRPNSQCPKCGSLERHRLLWLYLHECTNLFSDPLTVLHFAPEPQYAKVFRRMPNLQYISVDLNSESVHVSMDITNIPLRDVSVDVILCVHVLEHIIDDRRAMRELFRVLKPSGWAILQVPIDTGRDTTFEDPSVVSPDERARLFDQHDHVRLYGRDYKSRLEEAGFLVDVHPYAHVLGSKKAEKYRLLMHEDVYHCTRN